MSSVGSGGQSFQRIVLAYARRQRSRSFTSSPSQRSAPEVQDGVSWGKGHKCGGSSRQTGTDFDFPIGLRTEADYVVVVEIERYWPGDALDVPNLCTPHRTTK